MSADKKTFSVLDAIQGRSYPEDDVTIYTDLASLYELQAIENKRAHILDADEVNSYDERVDELKASIRASGMTFHLRGFSTGVIQSINDEAKAKFGEDANLDENEPFIWRMDKYIAESIIRVENVDGDLDESRWDVENVAKLRAYLPDDEFNRLQALVLGLSFASWQFDQAVNADFS